MKHIYLLALLLTFSIAAFAQSAFKPGYFIDNAGNRVECFIKNEDKRANPTAFEYKLTEDAQIETATIADVQEFEILNTIHKYKRFEVDIDRSSNEVEHLTSFREPYFNKEVRFLRVLLQGKANLYIYTESGGFERFFAGLPGQEVAQLIYKKYSVGENKVAENKMYQNQLAVMLSCDAISGDRLNNTAYQERALLKLFADYNTCVGADITNYTDKKIKGEFILTPKLGFTVSGTKMTHKYKVLTKQYSNEFSSGSDLAVSPQIAIEAEYVFPFNNKSWSVFIEPGVQLYNQEFKGTYKRHLYVNEVEGTVSLNYSHIAVPFGFKYSYHTADGSSAFVKAAMSFNAILDDSDVHETEGFNNPNLNDQNYFSKPSYVFGVGYELKKRMSLEVNYNIKKNVVDDDNWEIDIVNSFSVLLGYRIL